MGKFFEEYKNNMNSKGISGAYDLIVNDLLQHNLKGANKQKSLTGYNMESDAMVNFAPSMFYVFLYNNPNSKVESVTDYAPMIFCTGFSSKCVTGINFNLLPNDVRAIIIDTIIESYPNFYTDKNLSSGGFVLNEKLASGLIGGGSSAIIKALKMKTGFDISSSVRSYNVNFIIKSRMLEYDMWKYIPLLCFKDVVRGIKLAEEQLKVVNMNK